MKISKNLKRGCALALTAMLALTGVNLMQTKAAGPIIQDQVCKLTVSVDASILGDTANAEDFTVMSIPVEIYKVADVSVSGEFTAAEAFSDIDFNVAMNQDTNAATWEELAAKAVEKLEASEEQPAAVGTLTGGTPVVFQDLSVGMYLVMPEDTMNGDASVKYVFTPYLTALPSSTYTLTGAGSDEWQYDREISLKGETEHQFGKLTIQKTLENYNTTLDKMTCVFEIEGKDAEENVVYSNVASITLDSADAQHSVTIENIPAGLDVTVTEVYTGASYEVVGESVKSTTIVSDAGVEAGNAQASVAFRNRYNGGNRGGYGVTNAFKILENGDWEWTVPDTPPTN